MSTQSGVSETKAKPNDLVLSVYRDYLHGMDVLNSPDYSFLRGETPLEYWADGRKRFNSIFPSVDQGVNNWMSDYVSNMTRDKCMGIVAHAVSRMIDSSIVAQNDRQEEDQMVAEYLKDVVEYTKRKENFDEKFFWAIVTAIAEGNVVLADMYGPMGNLQGGKRKKGAFTLLVPNEEFLRNDPYLVDIQEQEWVMWRRKMTHGRAKRYFGHYKNWDQVQPGKSSNWQMDFEEYRIRYDQFAELADNEVEIVQRWRKDGDKCYLDIVANGVQLTEDDEENPRKDGQYPFAECGFEPMDAHFFMRASLTKKLQKDQESSDRLWRSWIDRQELRNKPPVATNRPELTAVDIIIPGNAVYVGENENYKIQPIIPQLESGIDSGTVNLIQALMKNADSSSAAPQTLGQNASGGTTATEVAITSQSAEVMFGLFGRELSYLHRDWLRLRCQTCLWRVPEDQDMSEITIQDRLLTNGKTGKRKYKRETGLADMLEKAKGGAEEMRNYLLQKSIGLRDETKQMDGKAETILIDPENLLNLEIYVYTDGELQPKRTGSLAKAMAMEDWQVYSSRPDVFNQVEAAEDLVKARGGDPSRLVLSPEQQQQNMAPPADPTSQPEPTGPSQQLTGSVKRLMGNAQLAGQ